MPEQKQWTTQDLRRAVADSYSKRQVIKKLGLIPAGGNYDQISAAIAREGLDTSHFTGKGWRKGKKIPDEFVWSLDEILVENSSFQSNKLKNRLFRADLKKKACEECGWAKKAEDGRLPLELDHINGNARDNRLENIRILCPNCHNLKATHRARNIKRKRIQRKGR